MVRIPPPHIYKLLFNLYRDTAAISNKNVQLPNNQKVEVYLS
jgi:hypothetical protein